MYSSTSAPLSARPLPAPFKKGQVYVDCSLCGVSFTFEAAAFKPNADPLCFGCLLELRPPRRIGGPRSEEIEDTSSSSDQSSAVRKKSSKQVRFRVGGLVFYPGASDLPKVESKIFRCEECQGSLKLIRTASTVPCKRPRSVGPIRLVKSTARRKPLLCLDCMRSKGSDGIYSVLRQILYFSFHNILSPLFWFLIKCFVSLCGMVA